MVVIIKLRNDALMSSLCMGRLAITVCHDRLISDDGCYDMYKGINGDGIQSVSL